MYEVDYIRIHMYLQYCSHDLLSIFWREFQNIHKITEPFVWNFFRNIVLHTVYSQKFFVWGFLPSRTPKKSASITGLHSHECYPHMLAIYPWRMPNTSRKRASGLLIVSSSRPVAKYIYDWTYSSHVPISIFPAWPTWPYIAGWFRPGLPSASDFSLIARRAAPTGFWHWWRCILILQSRLRMSNLFLCYSCLAPPVCYAYRSNGGIGINRKQEESDGLIHSRNVKSKMCYIFLHA